ncbi:MAG TPA: SpoIIE family protein phosphatase [Spirochaetia bacterium]|nr:SpoIIE family protein phosphatase [Spirochaetia bacterium]
MRSWGLKPRFLLFAFALFLAAGIISFGFFFATARGIVESLGIRFAETNTLLARARMMGIIEPEVVLARKLADSPVVKGWILDEDNPAKSAAARAELESYRRAFSDHSYFVAIATSGTYYNQPAEGSRTVVRLSRDRPSDSWFFRTLESQKDWQLNLDYNPYLRVTKVWINCVVRDADKPIGLAGSGIEITDFLADLAKAAQEGLSVMLVDDQGNIMASRDLDSLERNARTWTGKTRLSAADLTGSAHDRDSLSELLRRAANDPGVVRTARLGFEGTPSLVAASSLPSLGWTIVAAVNLDKFITVNTFVVILIVFLAALALLLVAVALSVDRLILMPLGALSAAAGEVARGLYHVDLPLAGIGEIGALASSFSTMAGEVRAATENLERQVKERTQQLAEANNRMVEDLEYADLIQRSILPGARAMDRRLPERFILFHPRYRVGGDFYFFRDDEDSFLLGVADCTGHGVSGALMTMYAQSALEAIAARKADAEPSALIEELDEGMRSSLAEDTGGLGSERGLEIALCRIEPGKNRLFYAGAGIDLFGCSNGGASRIRAGRGGIGSRRRRQGGHLSSSEMPLNGTSFYLTTDGLLDLPGGPRGFGFGSNRFASLISSLASQPLSNQRGEIEAAMERWRGDLPPRDDITVIGFRL